MNKLFYMYGILALAAFGILSVGSLVYIALILLEQY